MLGGIPSELIVFIISLFPILECRGGMIAASLLGVDYWLAAIISVVGNLLPIPFIFLFIEKIFNLLKKTKRLGKLVTKIENKAMSKSEKVTKYKRWGLLLFVGIPLPGTGAWTGALIAVLLKLNLKDSVISILLGVVLALAIMSFITYGIPWILINWDNFNITIFFRCYNG
ncbi:MAG: small multi-drug export protein [Ruminococcaceae bacterium]|nr:small multi-drug export protein [Oscillospiraceae bacterium]